MIRKTLAIATIANLLATGTSAETPFEACNLRFLDSMSCIEEACGPQDVLHLPPEKICEPRPCDEFLSNTSATSGLEYSWCKEDFEAAGGEFDELGRPKQECRPNPDYLAANAKADEWLTCQARAWSGCDGAFVDKYKVAGGFDLLACQKDFKNGRLPSR